MEMSSQAAILRRFTTRRPHVALNWDSAQGKVVAERAQVGLSWKQACSETPNGIYSQSFRRLVDGFNMPEELFELSDLSKVLNIETWETYLSEPERELLSIYLPGGVDQKSTLQALMSGENFHFGNPLRTWGASVCAGAMHPDALLRSEFRIEQKQKSYFKRLRNYHANMINSLQLMKEVWEECEEPEDFLPRIARSLRFSQTTQNHLDRKPPESARASREFVDPQQDRSWKTVQTSPNPVTRKLLESPKRIGESIDLRQRHCSDTSTGLQEIIQDRKDISTRHKAKRQKIKSPEEGKSGPKITITAEEKRSRKIKSSVEAKDLKENSNSDFERDWFEKYVEVTISPLSGAKLSDAVQSVKVTKKIFMEVKLRSEAGEEVHIDSLDPMEGRTSDMQSAKEVEGSCHSELELIPRFWKTVLLKDLLVVHANFMRRKGEHLKLAKLLASSCKKGLYELQHTEVGNCEAMGHGSLASESGVDVTSDLKSKILSCAKVEEKPFAKQWFGKHLFDREVQIPSGCAMHDRHGFDSTCGDNVQSHSPDVHWAMNIKDSVRSPMPRILGEQLVESSLSQTESGESQHDVSPVILPSREIPMQQRVCVDTDGRRLVERKHPFEHEPTLISRHQSGTLEDATGLFRPSFAGPGKQELQLLVRGGQMELPTAQEDEIAAHVAQNARKFLTEHATSSHQYKNPVVSLAEDSQRQSQQNLLPLPMLQQRQYPNYLASTGSLPLPLPSVDLAPLWSGSVRHTAGGALPQLGGPNGNGPWSATDASGQWGMAEGLQNANFRGHLHLPPTETSRWNLSAQEIYEVPGQISRRPELEPDQQPFYTDWSSRHDLPALNDTGAVYRTPSWYPPVPFENVGPQIQHSAFNHHCLWPCETGPSKAVPHLWGSMDYRPS